jgi:hypothetical protein
MDEPHSKIRGLSATGCRSENRRAAGCALPSTPRLRRGAARSRGFRNRYRNLKPCRITPRVIPLKFPCGEFGGVWAHFRDMGVYRHLRAARGSGGSRRRGRSGRIREIQRKQQLGVDAMTPAGIFPHRVHGQSVAAILEAAPGSHRQSRMSDDEDSNLVVRRNPGRSRDPGRLAAGS